LPTRTTEAGNASRREAVWFAWLAGWVAAVWLLSSLLAPALHDLLAGILSEPPRFARVARRVAMLLAIGWLVFWIRRWSGFSAEAFGFRRGIGGPRRFLRLLAVGLACSAVAVTLEAASGRWVWDPNPSFDDLLEATLGALAIGFLEEGVFRGFLLQARPPLGAGATAFRVTAVSALYAAIHFARGGSGIDAGGAGAGFAVWERVPVNIASELDGFVGLFFLGLLFAAVALRERETWGAAGLHAGFVVGVRLGTQLFDSARPGSTLFLTDRALPGWGSILPLAAAAAALFWRGRRSR
jgi:hypothetical protein